MSMSSRETRMDIIQLSELLCQLTTVLHLYMNCFAGKKTCLNALNNFLCYRPFSSAWLIFFLRRTMSVAPPGEAIKTNYLYFKRYLTYTCRYLGDFVRALLNRSRIHAFRARSFSCHGIS